MSTNNINEIKSKIEAEAEKKVSQLNTTIGSLNDYGKEDVGNLLLNIIQTGAGQLTIQATTPGTTTIASTGASSVAPKLRAQNSAATLVKTSDNQWYVMGDIS